MPHKPAGHISALASQVVRPAETSDLPAEARLYWLWTVILAMSAVVAAVYYIWRGRPLDANLWSPAFDRYGDFWHYHLLFGYFHTARFFTGLERFAYPAPSALIYDAMYHLGPHKQALFLSSIVLSAAISGLLFCRGLIHSGIRNRQAALFCLTLLMTSWPWLTLYQRANIELILYLFVAAGTWALFSGRPRTAAMLYGAAAAFKLYPLLLLGTFLSRRHLRSFFIGVGTCAGLLLASFWFAGPTVRDAFMGTLHGIGGFVSTYAGVARRQELNTDHSLLGAIKEILSLHILRLGQTWPQLTRLYLVVVAVAILAFFLLKVRTLPLANRLSFFLIAMVLFPPVSYDYTLVHVYVVFALVVFAQLDARARGEKLPRAAVFYACFLLLFTPQTYIAFRGLRINGLLKATALAVLLFTLLRTELLPTFSSGRRQAGSQPLSLR